MLGLPSRSMVESRPHRLLLRVSATVEGLLPYQALIVDQVIALSSPPCTNWPCEAGLVGGTVVAVVEEEL